MTQQQLANKIGVHERTIRKWLPRKRKQWQALASKGRDAAWFDLLAQLCFEVDAHNATDGDVYYSLEIGRHCSALVCYTNQMVTRLLWAENLNNADCIAKALAKINN